MFPPRYVAISLAVLLFQSSTRFAGAKEEGPAAGKVEGYTDSPLLPGTSWHVHDPARPQPPVVTPGPVKKPGAPPSDATILFDGRDLSAWTGNGGGEATWTVTDGEMTVGEGNIATREEFGDIQLHVEFATPVPPRGKGQGRANSGIFLMGRYELQVLDSYGSRTYPDGQAAAIYGQHPPLVNASRPPGEWQTYEVIFRAPRFGEEGALVSPASITVLHNGVLVQDGAEFLGATRHRDLATYSAHPLVGPIVLQDHGNPVRYRNIWVRTLSPQTK